MVGHAASWGRRSIGSVQTREHTAGESLGATRPIWPVAQSVEHTAVNRAVLGSTPSGPANFSRARRRLWASGPVAWFDSTVRDLFDGVLDRYGDGAGCNPVASARKVRFLGAPPAQLTELAYVPRSERGFSGFESQVGHQFKKRKFAPRLFAGSNCTAGKVPGVAQPGRAAGYGRSSVQIPLPGIVLCWTSNSKSRDKRAAFAPLSTPGRKARSARTCDGSWQKCSSAPLIGAASN